MKTQKQLIPAATMLLILTLQASHADESLQREASGRLQACISYGQTRDTNTLAEVEKLFLKSPKADGFPLGLLKVDGNSLALCRRLVLHGEPGATWKHFAVLKLRFQASNEELLALHVALALDERETDETRQMAASNLLQSKWPESEGALNAIFLAREDRKARLHLITIAINTKRASVAGNLLRLFEWKHPDATLDVPSKHEIEARRAEHRELQAKVAEAVRTGAVDPVELNRATTKWFRDFLAEKHVLPPGEVKQKLARFGKLPVLERMKLAYGILQSNGAADTEIARLVEKEARTEPSAFIRGWLLQARAFALGTTDEAVRFLRTSIARERDSSVQNLLEEYQKVVEADLARSRSK